MKQAKRFISLLCAILLVLSISVFASAECDHVKSDYVVTEVFPSCYQSGVGKYVCVYCGISMGTKTIPATGFHNPTGPYIITDTTHYTRCATEGCTARVGEEEHSPGRTVADQEPTCGTAGVGHINCDVCGTLMETEVYMRPTGMHEEDVQNPVVDIEPTCSEKGKGHIICINCGQTTKPLWTFPATGEHKMGAYVVVQKPSCVSGWEEATCTGCDLVMDTRELAPTEEHKAGPWKTVRPATSTQKGLKEKRCKTCNTLLQSAEIPVTQSISFGDVKKSDFYYTPVQWAVENNITSGTSPTTFAPAEACTRGQIATFLWRAAGQPKAKTNKNPFVDVRKSDYYYTAVLWAVGEGVTAGTSKTTFEPAAPCTRGQIVTFLYRSYH